jgi:nitroimidazol reductase NimA-like FMN-containing flavoprotein (pyridoxamine 5'-phosphate oxidase superfamily)
MMNKYHMRRNELAMKSRKSMIGLIMRQSWMAVAMCRKGEPYLVTVDYAFDKKNGSFYFHCSPAGKKNDYIVANPSVWGEVVEDLGYIKGECEHAYRSVMFRGRAEFVADTSEKKRALGLMVDKVEENPRKEKKRLINQGSMEKVSVVRIKVLELSGKESLPKKA